MIALGGIAVTATQGAAGAADPVEDTRTLLSAVFRAVDEYLVNAGRLPAADRLLAMLTAPPAVLSLPATRINPRGEIIDYWGRPIRYLPGEGWSYTVYSVGANGRDENGGGDDFGFRR